MFIGIGTPWVSRSGSSGAVDPFPELSGEFIHYRQEDVTSQGVRAAHGLPLAMQLHGEVGRVVINGVEFFDGLSGVLHEVKDTPWPSNTPFALWALSGSRGGTIAYNGLEGLGTASLRFSSSSNVSWGSDSSTNWDMPDFTGPETIHWYSTGGTSAANWPFRHNGVLRTNNGGWKTGSLTSSSGPLFMIGGYYSNGSILRTSAKWRDVVLKVGSDFTTSERNALAEYATERLIIT